MNHILVYNCDHYITLCGYKDDSVIYLSQDCYYCQREKRLGKNCDLNRPKSSFLKYSERKTKVIK
jgi:hypothetical protein